MDDIGLGIGHHQIKQGSIAKRLKLVAVRMTEEPEAMLCQRFSAAIKDSDCFAAGLLVKGAVMRYPGAAHVLKPQCFRFCCDRLDIVPQTFIRIVSADRLEALCVEQLFEFLW